MEILDRCEDITIQTNTVSEILRSQYQSVFDMQVYYIIIAYKIINV